MIIFEMNTDKWTVFFYFSPPNLLGRLQRSGYATSGRKNTLSYTLSLPIKFAIHYFYLKEYDTKIYSGI